MTSQQLVREEMVRRDPNVGDVFNLASATTTTAVVTILNTGKLTAGKYIDRYLVRPDAATAAAADRERICTNFASATGTFTHAGTNYTDTTATNEKLEVLVYKPRLYDQAIDLTLGQCRHTDSVELPALSGATRYWLNDFPWITSANDIRRVERRRTSQISRNRYHEKWNSYSTSGVLQPDFLTISGSGATMGRSTTQTFGQSKWSLFVTRATVNATATEEIGLMQTGVSADSLRGMVVTGVIVGWSTDASQLRVGLNDGVTTTYSSYHTGDETWQELTIEKTLSDSATKLDLVVENNGTDGTVYLAQRYAVTGTLTDGARRDVSSGWETIELDSAEQSSSMPIELPSTGRGTVYRIWVDRPYPRLDLTRLDAGTADDDEIDAPVELVAVGALHRLYEAVGDRESAYKWQQEFEAMQKLHLYRFGTEHNARPTYGRSWTGPSRVMRYR